MPIPEDSIAICSFGDASSNHATAQCAFNTAQWTAYQKLPAPVLFVCEDNGIGISVKTPGGWVGNAFRDRHGLDYFFANGLDLAEGYEQVARAVYHCRSTRRPTFLHLRTTRIMGHAGTDFEIEYRALEELLAVEATDPLLRSAEIALASGLMLKDEVLAQYEAIRGKCMAAAEHADKTSKILTREEVMRPLAPYTPDAVRAEATRMPAAEKRLALFGSEKQLPENLPPRHLAIQINQALHDLFLKYPQALLFGEDVAQKGGVYTVTKGMHKAFKSNRVFNTLLDETTILGLAQGFANMGMLPFPEIQYLAYFHNACDQIRGEACSLQFFSNDQYRNPMVDARCRTGLSARLWRAFPQRQFGHRLARHSRPDCRLPESRRRCGDDAAHTRGARDCRRPRQCLPRTDRAVHDQGPLRGRRRAVVIPVSGTRPGT